ncbi:Glutaredoxin domain-containing cysteine-rich protein CG31559 [Gryllus bimaculatus]|nr:Glutaredoxin domain-containing cysteine-rich protein CG31559 [Gryllus bimaculatus]
MFVAQFTSRECIVKQSRQLLWLVGRRRSSRAPPRGAFTVRRKRAPPPPSLARRGAAGRRWRERAGAARRCTAREDGGGGGRAHVTGTAAASARSPQYQRRRQPGRPGSPPRALTCAFAFGSERESEPASQPTTAPTRTTRRRRRRPARYFHAARGAPCGGGSGPAQPLSSISTSGEHVVKIRINPDGPSAGSIRISVGSQDSTVEDMVRRPADAFLKQPERNNPYFFCSSFPTSGMVISSGQSSPSDTLDSGTCSDLDGSTPPPLPKKNGVSAAAAAAAAATVTVTVNGSHPQHRRTASLTSSGNDADSDEDAGSNISCDSLNSHELNGGGELDDSTHYAFSKIGLSNGHHKHSETIMESIQEEKIISPPSPTLKSVALTVRANNLVNNPMTAAVAPLVAATAATVTANNTSAHMSNNSFSASNNSFSVSNNSFGTSNSSFGASNNSFGTSSSSFGASDRSFGVSDNAVSAIVNGAATNVVTFNGPLVNSPASAVGGVPKPPPPKTPAKPAKAIPSPPTPPKTPSSPTGQKTFLPQGLLQDIRDRTATLNGVSSTPPATPGTRKLRTWGEITPPKTPEPASPEPKEYPKNQSSLYRILQTTPSEPDSPKTSASGGIVKERTYEERTREITAEAQNAAAAAEASRARIGSYKYEEDRYYQFHLNEREPEPEDPKAVRATDEEDEETFAGLKDIMGNKEGSATIRSAKGTVRGVKNRVRAGIATFLHYPDTKNYKEKEAGKVVLYVTTMGIVRHTFQECLKVKKILRTLLP